MVANRMSSPLGLAVAKSKLVAFSTIATGYLSTSPITAAPAAVVSSLIVLALLPLEGGGPSLPLFPSGEPDPPAPPLPPEPLPPEPPLAELPPLPPLALEPPLPPLVLLPPEPPVEPPVEPPDPAVLPPLPPVRDPPLPPVALLPPLPPWLPPLSGWGQPAARVMVKTIPARSRRDAFAWREHTDIMPSLPSVTVTSGGNDRAIERIGRALGSPRRDARRHFMKPLQSRCGRRTDPSVSPGARRAGKGTPAGARRHRRDWPGQAGGRPPPPRPGRRRR